MRQVHKRIVHLACLIHRPCLLSLPKEMLQTLADDRAADTQYKIRHVAFVIPNKRDSLIKVGIHGLTSYQHRTLRLHEHTTNVTHHMRRRVGRNQLYLTLLRQCCDSKIEQWFGDRHIDMHRSMTNYQRLVDQAVTVPTLLVIMGLRQGNCLADKMSEGIGLRQRLSIELVNPCLGTIGRNHHQGDVLIVSLGNGRSEIKQGGATGDTDNDRCFQALAHTECIEACRALIGNWITSDVRTLVEIMNDGGVAAARTDHRVTDAVSNKQGRKYVDVFFLAVHINIIKYAWFRVLPPFPATPVPRCCPSEGPHQHRDGNGSLRYSYIAKTHRDGWTPECPTGP